MQAKTSSKQTKIVTEMTCPLCGSMVENEKLEELGIASEVLIEAQQLRQRGILMEAMLVAVKIAKTANENPILFKQLLDENNRNLIIQILNGISRETKPILQAIAELKGSPQTCGKIEEVAIAKRLKAIMPEDYFTTERSTKGGEDVTAIVRENKMEIGKIIIESKRVKKWQSSFVEQAKEHIRRESTEFGIIATTVMPDDALSYATVIDGILIVKMEYIEPAYIFTRSYMMMKKSLETEYAAKLSQLEIKEQVLHKLREAIMSGELDTIIENVNNSVNHIDELIATAENYLVNKIFAGIRKDTRKIRELTAKLVNEHIQKIRLQLQDSLSNAGSIQTSRGSSE